MSYKTLCLLSSDLYVLSVIFIKYIKTAMKKGAIKKG